MESVNAAGGHGSNDHMKSPRYEDPSARIWSTYLSEAEKYDEALAHSWKSDMDAILIFAGLFSASVTAFLVESNRYLVPDSEDRMVVILGHISNQIASMSPNGDVHLDLPVESFQLSSSAFICNILWYLSLSFSLLCALFATLIQQWTRNYRQAAGKHSTPQRRARISAYLYQGINRFKMAAIVELIPLLLHISLFLFFSGLVAYLFMFNNALAYVILGVVVFCTFIYGLVTFIPFFCLDCPYRTPLTLLSWHIVSGLRLLHWRDTTGTWSAVEPHMTLADAREHAATEISPERDERDFRAMSWALETIRDDSQLESFVEVIPKVVACTDYSAKLLLHRLLEHDAVTVRLGYRIPRLLMSCAERQLKIEKTVAQTRAATCLKAIWSLSMMSLPGLKMNGQAVCGFRESLRFDEDTLKSIDSISKQVYGISEFSASACMVVSRRLLDVHLDRAFKLETEVHEFLRTRRWNNERHPIYHLDTPEAQMAQRRTDHANIRIQFLLSSMEPHLRGQHTMSSAGIYLKLDSVRQNLEVLLDTAAAASGDIYLAEEIARQTLEYIDQYRIHLHQIGFQLITEYLSLIVHNHHGLPYEPTNTLRRLWLRVNQDQSPSGSFSVDSQAAFTHILDEALVTARRLPESIVNILLGILVRGVITDPPSAVKARRAVRHFIRISHLDGANEAAWLKAVEVLDQAAERWQNASSIQPVLDIFRFHMYANIKLEAEVPKQVASDEVLTSTEFAIPLTFSLQRSRSNSVRWKNTTRSLSSPRFGHR